MRMGAETRVRAGLVQIWGGEERRVSTDEYFGEDRRITEAVDQLMKGASHIRNNENYSVMMARYEDK